jgi:hypothetical protein
MQSFSQMVCTFDTDAIVTEIEFGEGLDKRSIDTNKKDRERLKFTLFF